MPPLIGRYFDIKRDAQGQEYLEVYLEGFALLRLALTNKGTAFTAEERHALGLDGLLPPAVKTLEQQLERLYRGYLRVPDALGKYQYLRALQERSEVAFYALLERHLEKMLPIIYTPTVGQAVQEYSYIYQSPRGLSLSPLNIEQAADAVRHYPWQDVRMVVATDSSAILGIGDQGYGGLAIAIGKLALYTVAGGISPFHTMPVKLDVGTDRLDLIEDSYYLGVPQRRLRGPDYDAFMDRFVEAVQARWPKAVIQWEDLAKDNAFRVLERYRDRIACFNDDIQGTGAVALAGLLVACEHQHESLTTQRIAILGAGAGGIGVAWTIVEGLQDMGLSRAEACARVFVLDSKGLLLEGRAMDSYKAPYAQPREVINDWQIAQEVPTLLEVIQNAKVTALLGLSGQAGAFNEPIVKALYHNTARPIVFPLSNPTSICEALPADIMAWTQGQAIVATGSPFADVDFEGTVLPIGQGNNAFIFPGLGLATVLAECTRVTDTMVREAAYALAEYTITHHAAARRVFPPIQALPEVSVFVARRVMAYALREGLTTRSDLIGSDLEAFIRAHFWKPRYLPFRRGHKTAGVE